MLLNIMSERAGSRFVIAFIVLLIAFPKSGLYVGSLPVYLLYVVMALGVVSLFLMGIVRGTRASRGEIYLISAMLPFWAVWFLCFAFFGYDGLAHLVGQIFVFFVIPIFYIALLNGGASLQPATLAMATKLSVRFAVLFGILSFVYAMLFGDYLNFAYLTTAGGEPPLEVWQRNNMRGDFLKLVSTYNNGNIYGVCMLALSPLYVRIERNKIFVVLFFLALMLTLSRTVWAITLLSIVMIYGSRLSAARVFACLLLVVVFVAGLVYWSTFLGGWGFLFDSTMGNRSKFFWMLEEFRFVPHEPISVVLEIPYISVYYDFGLVGLVAFCMFFFAPVLIYRKCSDQRNQDVLDAINLGMLLYVLTSFSDVALIYVPSFAVFMYLFFLKSVVARSKSVVSI